MLKSTLLVLKSLISFSVGMLISFVFYQRRTYLTRENFYIFNDVSVKYPYLSSSPIEIVTDAFGIPHVTGKTKVDVYFAQGFLQAKDRLSQLETLRRISSGRLSELNGKFLELDKLMRTFGFRRKGESDFQNLSESEKIELRAFVDGVNYFLSTKYFHTPVELLLSGLKLEKFTVEDFLAIHRFVYWEMNMSGWIGKLMNHVLEGTLSKEDFDLIAMKSFRSNFTTWKSGKSEFRDINFKKIVDIEKFNTEYKGSNCFAVSGNFTESGKPIFGSDPHLEIGLPSVWYRNHIKCDEFNAEGVTIIGAWGIGIGHNEHISYGLTLSCADMFEIYEEKFNENGDQYLYEGEWKEVETVEEVIKVNVIPYIYTKKVVQKIRYTHHGPVLSDVWNYESTPSDSKTGFTVKAVSLDEDPMIDFMNLAQSRNYNDFRKRASRAKSASFNICYADVFGNIGYFMTGSIPIRTKHAIERHSRCMDGTSKNYEWQGYYDTLENPQALNPEGGIVVSANHKIVSYDYDHFLGYLFFPPNRAQRIRNLLEEKINRKQKISLEYAKEIMTDITIEDTDFITFLMDEVLTKSDEKKKFYFEKSKNKPNITVEFVNEVASRIKKFNGIVDKNSVEALLFITFQYRLLYVLFSSHPKIGGNDFLIDALMGGGIDRRFFSCNEYSLKHRVLAENILSNTKKDSLVSYAGGKTMVVFQTIIETINYIREMNPLVIKEDYMKELRRYKYGDFHKLYFEHSLSDITEHFNVGPTPIGGSRDTVACFAQFRTSKVNKESRLVGGYPSARFAVDMKDVNTAQMITSPGNHENPSHPHYSDYVSEFVNDKYQPLLFQQKEYTKNNEGKISFLFKEPPKNENEL